jgi:2-phospho-L-lactate guanylyltransferase
MQIILPIKRLSDAKQRLSPDLDGAGRRGLCRAMAEDVLTAASGARLPDRITVVSDDPEIEALASRFGAAILSVAERGHATVAARAIEALGLTRGDSVLLLPGDIPGVSRREIDSLIEGHGVRAAAGPAVTIVPDSHGTGTNALALTPADAIRPAFGPGSFVRHAESARRADISPATVRPAGICLDIDTADDLRAFLASGAAPATGACTRAFLSASGLAQRLGEPAEGR